MSATGGSFEVAAHLPALIVVTPLIGAGLVALIQERRAAWALATIVSAVLPVLAVMLLMKVRAEGVISYAIGGWQPPYGIEYRIDILNAFVLVLVSAVGAVVMPFALPSVAADIDQDNQGWFYAVYLLCLTGLLGMAATGDAFNIFVFMEISSLATYVLIAMGRDRRALLAAYQYLIMGTIGATLYVIGVGFLYVVTGSLNLADIAERLGPAFPAQQHTIMAALAFVVVGMSLKLALFPLHVWLPNAYAFAPSFATVFLAATATKVAVYVLLRVYFSVFGGAIALTSLPVGEVLLLLSLAAMFIASIIAVYEDNVERMLAYSSVAQIGYITLGIAISNSESLTGSIVHLVNHAMMKAALFMAIGAVAFRTGTTSMAALAGIGRRMPVTIGAFVLAGLSIIGVPGTAGFVSKWSLGVGAVEHGWHLVAFLIVASSLISVLYIGRFVEVAYFREPPSGSEGWVEPPLMMLVPLLALAAATVYFGIDTSYTAEIAREAANHLLAGLKP